MGIVNLLGPHTVCQSCGMDTPPATTKYKNHRFPVEIISHAVWLYFRFCLSFRDVEELLFERGVVVTHEAIRTLKPGSNPTATWKPGVWIRYPHE
jgi:hypothetical protein